jgi:large subunit ribosomal protein L3
LSKDKHISKPEKGHLLKSGEEFLKHLKEYRVEETSSYEIGNQITVKNFEVGQKVDISGKSMGRGFAGYQKRHGFSRGPMSHGSKNHRAPGSTGAGTTPGRIYPGKRMAGRYGGKQITTKGLLVLKIDDQKNLIVVKGSVPGKPGSIVNIKPNNVVGKKGGEKS